MSAQRHRLCVFLFALFAVCLSLPAGAAPPSFLEDFSTTTYKNAVATTAEWDTGLQQLYLAPFVSSIVGSLPTSNYAYGIEIDGDMAFVALDSDGLLFIDISDPSSPVQAEILDTPGLAKDVVVRGDYAFVGDHSTGLQIINIANLAAPFIAANFITFGATYGITVEGRYAYLCDGTEGLVVVDILDPLIPTLAGSYNTPGLARGIEIAGDFAYVSDGSQGLQIIDISDPTNPTLAGAYDTPGYTWNLALSGRYAYVADGYSGLQVFNIADPTNPILVTTYDTPDFAKDIFIAGDIAYLTDQTTGLLVLDISNPSAPSLLETIDTPGSAQAVTVAGDHAFVSDLSDGFQVIEVRRATQPVPMANYHWEGIAHDIVVEGNYAYLCSETEGLLVMDVTDPTAPSYEGSLNLGGEVAVAVAGSLAYVIDAGYGFVVVDISDPANPSFFETHFIGGMNDIEVRGDYAYITEAAGALMTFNISDPGNVIFDDFYDMNGSPQGVTLFGQYAYVPNGATIQIIDITNPSALAYVGYVNTLGLAHDVAIHGDWAFVAASDWGLLVYDVSNPMFPNLETTYAYPGIYATGVTIEGNYLFLYSGNGGYEVYDISNPLAPFYLETFGTGYPNQLVVDGEYLYVAKDGTSPGASALTVSRLFQREFDTANNQGQSLTIPAPFSISCVRLTTAQTDTVKWEVHTGDWGWHDITPGAGWTPVSPGTQLHWRSTHTWGQPGVSPSVDWLQLEWLYNFAIIDAVTDIPNDQGKQVRIEWTRSGHDLMGDATQTVEYAVYREIDPSLATPTPELAPGSPDGGFRGAQTAAAMAAAGWDYLLSVPASVEDSYAVVVPTLADSTLAGGDYHTTFFVRAFSATPGVYYDSQPDSGYSVDNLAPGVPSNLVADFDAGDVQLTWDESLDADFQYFRVYRDTDPGFVPGPGNLVHQTAGTAWVDSPPNPGAAIYKVTALDFSGNESGPASSGSVIGVGDPQVFAFSLGSSVPNPFRTGTEIQFSLATPSRALLQVFDIRGRLVRTLVDAVLPAGTQSAPWDGLNLQGERAAAGVYLYRLQAQGFTATQRMVLLP